jgi:hypothetical protein
VLLDDTALAMQRVEQHLAVGKVIIAVSAGE